MGVSKEVEFGSTGITLSYWRINFAGVDIENNSSECRVGGYVSKADALAGKKAVEDLRYFFSGSNNPINLMTDPADYQSLLYDKIISSGNPFQPNKLIGGTLVSDLP